MKIPKTIDILGHTYKVETIDWIDSGDSDGFHCGNSLTISIDDRLPRTRREEIFMHEVIEAINYHLELKLRHPQIAALSSALYSVLKEIV